ncbi:MAG: TRASH domain-containing protein [Vulcanisaeta sp.]
MPFLLNQGTTQLRCSNCGKIIIRQPIVVKTCCVNKPWVFCSEQCYDDFLRKWIKN